MLSPEQMISRLKTAFEDAPFPYADAEPEWQSLVQILRSVFDEGDYPYPGYAPSPYIDYSTQAHRWFFEIDSLMPEYVPYLLPRLMASVVEDYSWGVSSLHHLIHHMDINGIENSLSLLPNHEHLDIETQRELQRNSFSALTEDQIEAMIEWLEFVRVYESEEFEESVESAINYWKSHLQSNCQL